MLGHRGRGGFSYVAEKGSVYNLQVSAGGQALRTDLMSSDQNFNLGIVISSSGVLSDSLRMDVHMVKDTTKAHKLTIKMQAKDQVAVEKMLDVNQADEVYRVEIDAEELYEFSEAGGIYVLSVESLEVIDDGRSECVDGNGKN